MTRSSWQCPKCDTRIGLGIDKCPKCSKVKRPTRIQREIAARFKAGEMVADLVWMIGGGVVRGGAEVEQAIRAVMLWQEVSGDE